MEAREYFEKEYGHTHIEAVVEMKDWVSLYGLMDEFAEWKVKNCSIPAVVSQRELLLDFAEYSENDKKSEHLDELVDNYLDSIKQ